MLTSLASLLWQAAAVAAMGAAPFLWRAGTAPTPLAPWAQRVLRAVMWSALVALVAGLMVLTDDAKRITGQLPALDSPLWPSLLTGTRLGQMWLVKQSALLLLALWLAARRDARRATLVPCTLFAAVFLVAGAWSGHGGVSEPLAVFLPLHISHGLLSAAWLGALPVWASLLMQAGDTQHERAYVLRALQSFSRFATMTMGVLLLSGAVIAWRQFGAWPALFATSAAAWLWLKLALLAVVLAAAWRVRGHHLARLVADYGRTTRAAALRAFAIELLAAFALFAAALQLAHSTPGGHEDIHWWLPFRLLPALLASSSFAQWQFTCALLLLVCAVPAWCLRYHRLAPLLSAAAILVGAQALVVRAFPSTYTRPSVPYAAPSIARGVALYAEHCVACHGSGGRGDGPQNLTTTVAPADLAQHTALHSAGDMFAWLSDGTPSGAMPGFRALLTDEQRWDLINLLRAFADGHRARIIDENIVAQRPWLAAPNFPFRANDGTRGELKDFRERAAVLLVFVASDQARTLAAQAAALHEARLQLLVVPLAQSCAELANEPLPCVSHGAEAAVSAYALLGRTLKHGGARAQLSPALGDAAFLIDRFGYVRARWMAIDNTPPWSLPQLRTLQQALANEPQIRAAPELHVH